MYNEFLTELKNKYNYDDDLMKAIEISIPVMVDTYGDNSIEDVLNLFNNVKIFATSDMSNENRTNIEKEVLGNSNSHITSEDTNPYGDDRDPGAYYSFEPIFDENMNFLEEKRWLVTNKGEKYKELFGTNINMPYFLHELNHAFAMQKSSCIVENNKITSKHGMFLTTEEFSKTSDKISKKDISQEDIILEEMINERYTQLQLTKLLNKDNYKDVHAELLKINHVPTSYSGVLIVLAEQLENLLTQEKLMDYRVNNNLNIKEEFNNVAVQSDIYNKYIPNENPWDYFSKICYDIFRLSSEGFKYNIEEYNVKMKKLMIQANVPLSSYRDIKYGTRSLEDFDNIVSSMLPEEEKEAKTL